MSNEEINTGNFEDHPKPAAIASTFPKWLKSEWQEPFHGKEEVVCLVGGMVLTACGIAAKLVDEGVFLDTNHLLDELSYSMSFGIVGIITGIGVWYRRRHKGN